MAEWVPVLVRLEDYTEITDLVARREAARPGGDALPTVTAPLTPARALLGARDRKLAEHLPWPIEALEQLATSEVETAKRWALALDVCAARPEAWYTTTEIAEGAGIGITQWRDAPRKIKKHLLAHYPTVPLRGENPEWPLCADGVSELSWAVTAEMAQRWLSVRGS